jgi:hypothetical protein
MTDFHDLIDTSGLTPDEEARLRRTHDLLVQAGPPADLPPALEEPPNGESRQTDAEIIQFPLPMRRRFAVAAIAAAALVLAAFGGGYLIGYSKSKPTAFKTERVVAMQGRHSSALAVLRIGAADAVGNWPMQLAVVGLPAQHDRAAYYELWLTKDGKPIAPCGAFRVHGKTTTVRFSVPYNFHRYDGWVVTAQPHDEAGLGPVVLT